VAYLIGNMRIRTTSIPASYSLAIHSPACCVLLTSPSRGPLFRLVSHNAALN